jgi:hypothetical protein
MQVGVKLGVAEHEGAVLGALSDYLLDLLLDGGLVKILGEGGNDSKIAKSHG